MRVGREALDADAMRLLEQHNPDVTFDWSRLKAGLGAATSAGSADSAGSNPSGWGGKSGRDERRRERRDRRTRPEQPVVSAPAASTTAADYAEHPHFDVAEPHVEDGAPVEALGAVEPPEPFERAAASAVDPVQPAEPVEPLDPEPILAVDSLPAEPVEPRYARLGELGLQRLRARYADVVARLEPKPDMPDVEREELMARAARLNPDAWLTVEAVSQALEEYESVFESLRPFLGRPARRRRL